MNDAPRLAFYTHLFLWMGFSGALVVKNLSANAGEVGSVPALGRYPGEGNGTPMLVFLPGEFHGQRGLEGYSPWGHKSQT